MSCAICYPIHIPCIPNNPNNHNNPDMAQKYRDESSYNSNLQEIQEAVTRDPLDAAGIGSSILTAPEVGLDLPMVFNLYRALHVYSFGCLRALKKLCPITKTKPSLAGRVWTG